MWSRKIFAISLLAALDVVNALTTPIVFATPQTRELAEKECFYRNGELGLPTSRAELNELVDLIGSELVFASSNDRICFWIKPTKHTDTDECVQNAAAQSSYFKQNFFNGYVKLQKNVQTLDNRCTFKVVKKYQRRNGRWILTRVREFEKPANLEPENNIAVCFNDGPKKIAYTDFNNSVTLPYVCLVDAMVQEGCETEFVHSTVKMSYNRAVEFCANQGLEIPKRDEYKAEVKQIMPIRWINGIWFLNKARSRGNKPKNFAICLKKCELELKTVSNRTQYPKDSCALGYEPMPGITYPPQYSLPHFLVSVDVNNQNVGLQKYLPKSQLRVNMESGPNEVLTGLTISGDLYNTDMNGNGDTGMLSFTLVLSEPTTFEECEPTSKCPFCEYEFCEGKEKQNWLYFTKTVGNITGDDISTFNPGLAPGSTCEISIDGIKYPQLGRDGANGKNYNLGLALWFYCVGDDTTPGKHHADFNIDIDNCEITATPTEAPTLTPTESPGTQAPVTEAPVTLAPTEAPTHTPTGAPVTQAPGAPVTLAPTEAPTHTPTRAPVTQAPGAPVTLAPTEAPTEAPTRTPTGAPVTQAPVTGAPVTLAPTEAPTHTPTGAPVTQAPVTGAPTGSPTRALCGYPYTPDPTVRTDLPYSTPHFLSSIDNSYAATQKYVPSDDIEITLEYSPGGTISSVYMEGMLVNIGFPTTSDAGYTLRFSLNLTEPKTLEMCNSEGLTCGHCENQLCVPGITSNWTYFAGIEGEISGEDYEIFNIYSDGSKCDIIVPIAFPKPQIGSDGANGKNSNFGLSLWFKCEDDPSSEIPTADFNIDIRSCDTESPTSSPSVAPSFAPTEFPTASPELGDTESPTAAPSDSPTASPLFPEER